MLANFAELLDDGGHLCVADLEKEDGSFHGEGFDGHHGFGQSEMESLLQGAGFTGVSVERCCQLVRNGHSYAVFLATGTRASRAADS